MSGTPHDIVQAVLETAPESPSAVNRRLRGDLDNIVLRALRKEPERRYASVEQFSEDIRKHLEGLPVSAGRIRWRIAGRSSCGVTNGP